jgi:hypothetical protein
MLIGGAVGQELEQLMRMAGDVAEVDHPGRNAQIVEMADRMKHWLWGAGSVIVDPFITLLQIFFISLLVFVGARIFVGSARRGSDPGEAPRPVTFESAVRIVSYGMTPAILTALPLFGGVVAYLYKIVVTVIGAREVYRIGNTRATLVALFPHVLMVGVLMLFLIALLVALMKFFMMAF